MFDLDFLMVCVCGCGYSSPWKRILVLFSIFYFDTRSEAKTERPHEILAVHLQLHDNLLLLFGLGGGGGGRTQTLKLNLYALPHNLQYLT